MQKVIPISLGLVKVFLIKGEKNILIDTGMKGHLDKILEGLKQNGVQPADISMIIATHGHGDHVGELAKLKKLTGAKVVMHKEDAVYVSQGKNVDATPTGLKSRLLKLLFVRSTGLEPVSADILVEGELDLAGHGISGKVIATPDIHQDLFLLFYREGKRLLAI